MAAFPNLKRLFEAVNARPAARAREVGNDHQFKKVNDGKAKRFVPVELSSHGLTRIEILQERS